jgi:uncharacterized protein (TIRG00374 family)
MVLLRPVKASPDWRGILSATVIGFTAILLFGRAGELVRPYLIAAKEKVPFSSQVAILMLERVYDLLMTLLVFGCALAAVRASGVQVGEKLAWVLRFGGRTVTIVALILFILLILIRHFASAVQRRINDALGFLAEGRRQRVEQVLDAFVKGVAATRSDASMVAVLLYSILEWTLVGVAYWCVARAYAQYFHLSAVDIVVYMGFTTVGAIVQIPGVGGGIQVASVLVLTELYRVPLETAAGMSLVVWIISFVVISPVGLLLAFREGLSWRNLRRAGREDER